MERRRPGRRPHPNPPKRRYRTLSLATADDEEMHEWAHNEALHLGFPGVSQFYFWLARRYRQEQEIEGSHDGN